MKYQIGTSRQIRVTNCDLTMEALTLIPAEVIERKIYLIRGQKVMLDKDLAVLYGVKPI